MFPQLRARIRGLLKREAIEAEFDEELQSHLAREIARNRANGMSVADATAAARRAFGNIEVVRQSARDSSLLRLDVVGALHSPSTAVDSRG